MTALPASERWGLARLKTIRRDFQRMRDAVRSGDPDRMEEAWLDIERWTPLLEARASEAK